MGHPTLTGCYITVFNLVIYLSGEDALVLLLSSLLYIVSRCQCIFYPMYITSLGLLTFIPPSLETLFLFYPPEVGFGLPQEVYAILSTKRLLK